MNLAFAIAGLIFGFLLLYSVFRVRKAHAANDTGSVRTWTIAQSCMLALMMCSILGMSLTR